MEKCPKCGNMMGQSNLCTGQFICHSKRCGHREMLPDDIIIPSYEIRHQTKEEQKAHIREIANEMREEGLNSSFIGATIKLADIYEGVYDLMVIWQEEVDRKEKDETTVCIQNFINEKFAERLQREINMDGISKRLYNELRTRNSKILELEAIIAKLLKL